MTISVPSQLAFLHAPLMVWLSGATKRLLTRKKKKVKGQRRTAAKSGMPVPKDAEEDEEDEDKEDVHSGSDEDEQGLKFADTYENDEAWGKKGDAPVPAAFTSLNPLAKLAVQDPTNKAARRAAASGAPVDEATQMTSRVSAWASKLVLRSQDALAELSAQEAAAKPQALSALPASGKDEPPRPPASSLLVSRAYAGKGAAKH